MRRVSLMFVWVLAAGVVAGQPVKNLEPFSRIIISPKIELELVQGDAETIQLDIQGVEEHKVNVSVTGTTLQIYLDGARFILKNPQYDNDGLVNSGEMYGNDVHVRAKITYRSLRELQIRGEERIVIRSPLVSDEDFLLKVYGEAEVYLAEVRAEKFKAVLVGENTLHIAGGNLDRQKLRSIGENTIDVRRVNSGTTKTKSIGENTILVNSENTLKIMSIGESEIFYQGDPLFNKGLIIGDTDIDKID